MDMENIPNEFDDSSKKIQGLRDINYKRIGL